MSKELVISSNRHETRVAMIEDDQLVEVFHQRENEYSLAGSIHKGRVTRVLPGMQSAFVDIGLERDAFLYVSDFFEDNEEYDKIVTSVEDKVLKLDRTPPPQVTPPFLATQPAAAETAEAPGAGESAETALDDGPPPEAAPVEMEIPGVAAAAPVENLPAASSAVEEGAASAGPPPASAPVAPPPHHHGGRFDQQPRRDDRPRDDRDRHDDRRGGRRSRRRRGGQQRGPGGGRGLPDSKFYSPGGRPPMAGRPPETAPPPAPESEHHPAPPPMRPAPPDDFFVLPGESLAKYTRPGMEDEEAGVPELGEEEIAEVSETLARLEAEGALETIEAVRELDAAVEEVLAEEPQADAVEIVAEALAAELEPAPMAAPALIPAETTESDAAPSELAEAVEEAVEEAAQEADEAEEESRIAAEAAAESPETAEDVDLAASDAAEPLDASEQAATGPAESPEDAEAGEVAGSDDAAQAEEGTEGEETSEISEAAEAAEAADAAAEGAEGQPPVDEGPEPARIPTSLTATSAGTEPPIPGTSRFPPHAPRQGRASAIAGLTDGPMGARWPNWAAVPQGEPRPTCAGRKRASRPKLRTARPETAPRARAAREDRRSFDQRSAARRPGDHRPDRQGAAGPEGRPHHFAHRAARPLPGLHADRGPHRRLAQDSQRRRAPAPEAHSADAIAPAFPAATSCAPPARAAPKRNCAPT